MKNGAILPFAQWVPLKPVYPSMYALSRNTGTTSGGVYTPGDFDHPLVSNEALSARLLGGNMRSQVTSITQETIASLNVYKESLNSLANLQPCLHRRGYHLRIPHGVSCSLSCVNSGFTPFGGVTPSLKCAAHEAQVSAADAAAAATLAEATARGDIS